jgi:hypothetical protein
MRFTMETGDSNISFQSKVSNSKNESMRQAYEPSDSPIRAYEQEILNKTNITDNYIKMMSIKKMMGTAAHKKGTRFGGVND